MGTYSERHVGGHEQGIKVVRGEFHAVMSVKTDLPLMIDGDYRTYDRRPDSHLVRHGCHKRRHFHDALIQLHG